MAAAGPVLRVGQTTALVETQTEVPLQTRWPLCHDVAGLPRGRPWRRREKETVAQARARGGDLIELRWSASMAQVEKLN